MMEFELSQNSDVDDQVIDQINEHTQPQSQTKYEMELVKNRIKNRLPLTQNSKSLQTNSKEYHQLQR